MIEFRTGDILRADAEALVNTVNCVGVMGRGVALQFKQAFPENFRAYKEACARGEVQPGRLFVFQTGSLANPRYIVNFPTKRHWRGKSRIEDIEAGLQALVCEVRRLGIRSIAVPPLGSGLGGLEWRQVRPLIEAALRGLDRVHATVYEPGGPPAAAGGARPRKAPAMTAGRAALVGLVRRYLDGLMDPFVTLLEVHKLMYFMQEAGEPLRLRYVQGPYGPYAENLRHVLREIEGYFLSGYADGGDSPGRELTLVRGSVEEADAFLGFHPETKARFDRVAALVEGFETPFGLELLSTVHWVVTRQAAHSPDEVVAVTHAWGDRKKRFAAEQIRLALEVLARQSWLSGCTTLAWA